MNHITAADRDTISTLINNHSVTYIAEAIAKDRSSVYRELNRGGRKNKYGIWEYKPNYSHMMYRENRKRCSSGLKLDTRANHKLQSKVISLLREGWSPDEISGRLKLENHSNSVVSTECIYSWIYRSSYAKFLVLSQYLSLGRKKRVKWAGRASKRSLIPNRVSIHQRPVVVDKKLYLGDLEGDSVIYPNKLAINTINDRVSGLVRLSLLARKTAENTKVAMVEKISGLYARTLTLDNGLEFMRHEDISLATGVSIYFCDPYSSYQRGKNENKNKQLRKYLPKRHNIDKLTQGELNDIEYELNNTPRKALLYRTPQEVYDHLVNDPRKKLQLKKVAFGIRI